MKLKENRYTSFCEVCDFETVYVPVTVIDIFSNTCYTQYQCKTCFDDRLDPEDRY